MPRANFFYKQKLIAGAVLKNEWVYLCLVLAGSLVLNAILFSKRYIQQPRLFFSGTMITTIFVLCTALLLRLVAVAVNGRFYEDRDLMKRIGLRICFFSLITALALTGIFYGYDHFQLFAYRLNEYRYQRSLILFVLLVIFAVFLHEGVAGFEKWKATLTETERLRNEYLKTRLLGLKSQVNPHFLFNSLNSLSSLIQEDTAKAEDFLNEMSKVYRYLLCEGAETLVSMERELQFVRSYFYILQTRYGAGISLEIDVHERHREMFIPPFTMQLLLENIFSHYQVSKTEPLKLAIHSLHTAGLRVLHNMQQKVNLQQPGQQAADLENISNKFVLLCGKSILVRQSGIYSIIEIPLIKNNHLWPA